MSWPRRSWKQPPFALPGIDTSLRSDDWETLAAEAHGLKGDQPDDRGRTSPAVVCGQLEDAGRRKRLPQRAGRSRAGLLVEWEPVRNALEPSCEYGNNRMKILIAEDQPTAALSCGYMLGKWDTRRSSRQMVSLLGGFLRGGEAPLLISDWVMPRLDGPLNDAAASGPREATATRISSCSLPATSAARSSRDCAAPTIL